MVKNSFFEKHYTRLVEEAILKSALAGLIVGFFVDFLAALVAWFLDFGGIWFAIGIGAGVAILSGVIFYFAKFRPTTQDIARRVDRLGLDERLVTMLELQDDQSCMARLQRENAKAHLHDVSQKKIRFRVSKVMISLTVVAALVGAAMTTVVGLAEANYVPSGSEIITPDDPMANYIAVTYVVEEGGEINGVTDQLLLPGEDATPVVAVAEDGWMFVGWDDGSNNPERHDIQVTQELVVTALFEMIEEGGEEGEDGMEGHPGEQEGDKAEDVPAGGDSQVESDKTGQGENGSASGADGKDEGGSGTGEEEGEGKGDGQGMGAGGKWEDSNQFIDGQTYYRDYLDMYYQMAQEIFEENGEIPPELRKFFEMYFGSI